MMVHVSTKKMIMMATMIVMLQLIMMLMIFRRHGDAIRDVGYGNDTDN